MSRVLNVLLKLNTQDFDKGFLNAQRKIAAFGSSLQSVGQELTTKLTLPLAAVGAAAVNAFAQFEKSAKALEAVTGSAKLTAEQINRLRKIAQLPGLGFEQAVKASARLQAVGLSAQDAEEAIKQFGNAVARSGGGAAEFDGAILALTQIASKGKISAEEINQLNERIFEIRPALQAAFGTSDSEKLQKLGISSEEFISKVTAQLATLQRVQGGVSNSFENFRDSVSSSLAVLGESIVKSTDLTGKLDRLAKAISGAAEGFSRLSPETQSFIITVGGIAAAIGPASFAIGSLIKLLPTLRIGLAALTGPVGLVVAGLTAVALFISQLDFSKLKTSLDFRASVGSASGIASSPNIDIPKQVKAIQDLQRGASALNFAGVGKALEIPTGVAAPKAGAGGDFADELVKNITKASETVQRAARPLIEIPKLTGSAFGELAEQVDFSSIALVKSTTATDSAASSLDRVRESTAAWQEQVAAGIPLNIEAAVALEAQNERLEQQRQRFQNIADTIGGTVQDAFSGFFDTLLNGGKNAFKAFGEAIKALIKRLLTAVATALALSLIFSAITGGSGGALSLLGGSGSGFGGLFKTLLRGGLGFAKGGLVTGPVSALIGEGPGTTRANPEVVAPLDRLQQLLNNTQQAFVAEARISGDDLLFLVTNAQKKQGR